MHRIVHYKIYLYSKDDNFFPFLVTGKTTSAKPSTSNVKAKAAAIKAKFAAKPASAWR